MVTWVLSLSGWSLIYARPTTQCSEVTYQKYKTKACFGMRKINKWACYRFRKQKSCSTTFKFQNQRVKFPTHFTAQLLLSILHRDEVQSCQRLIEVSKLIPGIAVDLSSVGLRFTPRLLQHQQRVYARLIGRVCDWDG